MQSRCLAIVWLLLSISILSGIYFSLPSVVENTLSSARSFEESSRGSKGNATGVSKEENRVRIDAQSFTLVVLTVGIGLVLFAGYLTGRAAFIEIELTARYSALADAICISGNDISSFEKAAAVLVPKTKYLSAHGMISSKEIKSIAAVLKELR